MERSFNSIQMSAARCHTPRQFRRLLEDLRSVIPYRGLACKWGNARTHVLGNMVDVDYPRHYLGWYLANGMCRKDPVFQECIRTQQPQVLSMVMRRLYQKFDAEHIKKLEQYHLEHSIHGGLVVNGRVAYFTLLLGSEGEANAYVSSLGELLPSLCKALIVSYPYPVLTRRKKSILLSRAQGNPPKQIAHEFGISQRTVKMHLEEIRRKLYAEDLVHAVWIVAINGLIG